MSENKGVVWTEGPCVVCGETSYYCHTVRVCNGTVCVSRLENFKQETKTTANDRAYVEDMRKSRDDMRSSWEHGVLVRVDLERKLAVLRDRVAELEANQRTETQSPEHCDHCGGSAHGRVSHEIGYKEGYEAGRASVCQCLNHSCDMVCIEP